MRRYCRQPFHPKYFSNRQEWCTLVEPSNENIKRALKLVRSMLSLADKGDAEREDIGCGILYGIIRDAAFKIKKLAESEKESHMDKGKWS